MGSAVHGGSDPVVEHSGVAGQVDGLAGRRGDLVGVDVEREVRDPRVGPVDGEVPPAAVGQSQGQQVVDLGLPAVVVRARGEVRRDGPDGVGQSVPGGVLVDEGDGG